MSSNLNITVEESESILNLDLNITTSELNIDLVFNENTGTVASSGHTILSNDNTFPSRSKLKFVDATIIDNEAADETEVYSIAGTQGPRGPIGLPGVSGITYRGDWDATIDYIEKDCVRSTVNGNAYYCISSSLNEEPSTHVLSWSLFVMSGAPGESAYDYSVLYGFTGNEDSFGNILANLDMKESGPTAIAVGGVSVGSTLYGKTAIEILDTMLYPELFPNYPFIEPSVSLSLNLANLMEIGSVNNVTIAAEFDGGSITPQYQSASPYRSDSVISFTYSGPSSFSTTITDTSAVQNSYTISAGNNSWGLSASYSAGVQPKTNKGYMFHSPLPAGSTSMVSVNVIGVYPFFATSVASSTLTKQPLIPMDSQYSQVTLSAETSSNKQKVEFPISWSTITGIQFFNTINNTWEWIGGSKANSILTFDKSGTSYSKVYNTGLSTNYNSYSHNGAMIGSRQLRFYTT